MKRTRILKDEQELHEIFMEIMGPLERQEDFSTPEDRIQEYEEFESERNWGARWFEKGSKSMIEPLLEHQEVDYD